MNAHDQSLADAVARYRAAREEVRTILRGLGADEASVRGTMHLLLDEKKDLDGA